MARPAEPDVLALLAELRAAGGLPSGPGPDALPRPFGRYTLLSRLGPDRYRALDPTLDRDIVVEIGRESAPVAVGVAHPHLATVHAVGTQDGRPFLVRDHVRGRELASVVRDRPPSPRVAARWVAAVARAVEALHRAGATHGGISPQTVVLDDTGRALLQPPCKATGKERDVRDLRGLLVFLVGERAKAIPAEVTTADELAHALEEYADRPRRVVRWVFLIVAAALAIAAVALL